MQLVIWVSESTFAVFAETRCPAGPSVMTMTSYQA